MSAAVQLRMTFVGAVGWPVAGADQKALAVTRHGIVQRTSYEPLTPVR